MEKGCALPTKAPPQNKLNAPAQLRIVRLLMVIVVDKFSIFVIAFTVPLAFAIDIWTGTKLGFQRKTVLLIDYISLPVNRICKKFFPRRFSWIFFAPQVYLNKKQRERSRPIVSLRFLGFCGRFSCRPSSTNFCSCQAGVQRFPLSAFCVLRFQVSSFSFFRWPSLQVRPSQSFKSLPP